ncbi:transaldolase [Alphaproteobacteria bacterium]|nr:transaldolase [Alphaproteobacteria bacterium]
MSDLSDLKIKIYSDGAALDDIKSLYQNSLIAGFTTNPTLMRAAKIDDYEAFALDVLAAVPNLPVSFEIFADEFDEMVEQGLHIGSWSSNVNVKIPVVNTKGDFTGPVIERLCAAGIHINVTAVFTVDQVRAVARCLRPDIPAYISIFAGRIADSGIDPVPVVSEAVAIVRDLPKAELIWASPREVYNIFHADQAGCHIITVTPNILAKLGLLNKDQDEYALETAQMFFRDAREAGYKIITRNRETVST